MLFDLGLGWGTDVELLVGVDALLAVLALAAASAALAFFCLLSSAARLVLKVSVLGERLEGGLRDREWRWRLRERECLVEYGLLLRDLADRRTSGLGLNDLLYGLRDLRRFPYGLEPNSPCSYGLCRP